MMSNWIGIFFNHTLITFTCIDTNYYNDTALRPVKCRQKESVGLDTIDTKIHAPK